MRTSTTIAALLLIVVACSPQTNKSTVEQNSLRIETGLIPFTSPAGMLQPDIAQLAHPKPLTERMAYYKTPGVSIAVIHDNQIEWTKAYGTINIKSQVPVAANSIFEAASTSKFITAVLALHYVEQGAIDLDRNVNDYLQSWQVPENEFTQEAKVTLRGLLTHQAGLPTTNFDYDESIGYPTLIDVLNGASPATNSPATPELVPGSQWQYSNIGYDVIQLLLEDVTGRTFQQLAADVVFEPLGMNDSTFEYPLNSERRKREAMPHDADGLLREPSMHVVAIAHGGLTTTPTDLAKFTREIMLSYEGQSELLLSREMTRRLLSKESDLDPRVFGMPVSEGLGVFLMGEGKDVAFAHPGSNQPGLNCWLIGWPERGNAIVIMTNGAQGEVLAMEIVSAFNNEYNK